MKTKLAILAVLACAACALTADPVVAEKERIKPAPSPHGVCGPTGTADHPFSADSPQNTRLGADAKYAGEGDATTRALHSSGFGHVSSGNGSGFNIFEASPSDPVRTIAGVTLHVPPGAGSSDGGRDHPVVIIDGDKVGEFYHWNNSNAEIGYTYSIRGTGVPSGNERVGVSASGMSGLIGLMRGHEVNTPGAAINHVLQITLPVSMIASATTGPANHTDRYCRSGCDGPIRYGEHLAIPKSVNLDALDLSEAGKRVARAMQDYGVLVLDTNSGSPNIRGDQDISPAAKAAIEADLRSKLYPLLRVVTDEGTPAARAEACN